MLMIERTFVKRNEGTISNVRLEADVTKVTLDGKELPDSSVEYLLNFALQSLQDAYAGGKTLDECKALFAKKYDRLIDGKIGVRDSAETIDDATRIARKIVRQQLRANKAVWEKFAQMSEEDQIAALDKNIAKNAEKLEPLVSQELKRLAEEKKAKALLGKELSFEL